jgi:hypothetical protein
MRLINEVRRYSLSAGAHAGEAAVRVRGIDARVGGRGVTVERHEPLDVTIAGRAYPLPTSRGMGAAFALMPVAAFVLGRLLKRKEPRR